MSERAEEYKRIVTRVLAPEGRGAPKLADKEADKLFDRLDELWNEMPEDDREAIRREAKSAAEKSA